MADYTTYLASAGGSVFTALVLYLIRRFQENDMIPFVGRDSNRTRVLGSLARVNLRFGYFYKMMRNPEQTLRKNAADLNPTYLLATYWWNIPVTLLVIWEAIATPNLTAPFVTFLTEMEFLIFLVAIPHPSFGLAAKFWRNFGGATPRKRWAGLFANFRLANDVVGYLVFGILMSMFVVVLRAYLLKSNLTTLVEGSTPYGILAGTIASLAAVMVFRLVYFGSIHRIEDFAYASHFEADLTEVQLILRDADKTSEGSPLGEITSIGSALALERPNGYNEEFSWHDVKRIASVVRQEGA